MTKQEYKERMQKLWKKFDDARCDQKQEDEVLEEMEHLKNIMEDLEDETLDRVQIRGNKEFNARSYGTSKWQVILPSR